MSMSRTTTASTWGVTVWGIVPTIAQQMRATRDRTTMNTPLGSWLGTIGFLALILFAMALVGGME